MSIICPPERHIAVTFNVGVDCVSRSRRLRFISLTLRCLSAQDIYGIVKGSMDVAKRTYFEEICQLIESLYAQDFMQLRRNLKANFRPFSTGAKRQKLETRLGKGLPPSADLDMREVNLVADFMNLMCMARYHILTTEEWQSSQEESFTFQMPVQINWEYFDTKLLKAFWNSSQERIQLRLLLPENADRILIFHRGISLAVDSGLYVDGKIELLLSYLIVWPIKTALGWIISLASKISSSILSKIIKGKKVDLHGPPEASPFSAEITKSEQKTHRNAQVIERRSLRLLMPNLKSLLWNLPRKLTLHEPSFKEVVILYRTSPNQHSKFKEKPSLRPSDERLKDILARRNIHIKAFQNIPLADLEQIFPEKKVYLKTLSYIMMVVNGFLAFSAAYAMMAKPGEAMTLSLAWSALSMVAARLMQVYSQMQAERSQCVQDMTNILYEKTNDSQEGVVSMLLEDMADQQLKEAVLCYSMLYLLGDLEGGATEEELDSKCEDWLEENFGIKLDFAVEDALPRLVEWGLVTSSQEKSRGLIYNSVPFKIAREKLIKKWSEAYQALGKPVKNIALPLSSLIAIPDVKDDL